MYFSLAEGNENDEALYSHVIGYHIPAVRKRDEFYAKIEEEKMKGASR